VRHGRRVGPAFTDGPGALNHLIGRPLFAFPAAGDGSLFDAGPQRSSQPSRGPRRHFAAAPSRPPPRTEAQRFCRALVQLAGGVRGRSRPSILSSRTLSLGCPCPRSPAPSAAMPPARRASPDSSAESGAGRPSASPGDAVPDWRATPRRMASVAACASAGVFAGGPRTPLPSPTVNAARWGEFGGENTSSSSELSTSPAPMRKLAGSPDRAFFWMRAFNVVRPGGWDFPGGSTARGRAFGRRAGPGFSSRRPGTEHEERSALPCSGRPRPAEISALRVADASGAASRGARDGLARPTAAAPVFGDGRFQSRPVPTPGR